MRRRVGVGVGVAVGAALLLVTLVVAVRSRSNSAATAGEAEAESASRAQPRLVVHRYTIGSELTYALGYESDGTMELGDQAGTRLSSSVRARLVRTVVADAPRGGHLVLVRFLDAEVTVAIDESNAASAATEVARSLAEGVLVEEASDGHIVSLRALPSVSALALSFARTLLSGMQVTLPARPTASWNARETSPNGAYTASYAVVGEPGREQANGELALKKTKRPAQSSAEQGDWVALARGESRTSGATEIDFDLARGVVKELASEETVHSMMGTLEIATTRTKLDAERSAERVLDGPALAALLVSIAALREAEPLPLDARAVAVGDTARTNASKQWLGTTTLPEILTSLRASEARTQDQRHFDLFLKLHAFTYLHPDACARVAGLLAPLDPKGSSFQVVLASLGATGSREAQAALVASLHARTMSAEAKQHVTATLGMLPYPGEETEGALRSLRDESASPELAATASLGLGIMAKALASRSPKRAGVIVEEALGKAVADEHDEPKLLFDLSVLGNTGSPRIQHDVVRWSHATSASVRSPAAFALRFVRTDEAEARLLEMLAADDEASVRSRVASALAYREASARSFEVQRARMAADPDAGVRAALLRNVYAMRELFPEARAALEERRQGDPDAHVKQIADGLLGAADADVTRPP